MERFYTGQLVIFDGKQGYVNFISDEYITICIREYNKPPEVAEHSRNKLNQVCVCVFPDKWDQVLETSQNTKWYFFHNLCGNCGNVEKNLFVCLIPL